MTAPTLSPSELARELDDWADNFDDAELVTLLRAAALALREREAPTPTDADVERVARMFCRGDYPGSGENACCLIASDCTHWQDYTPMARAAIAAMPAPGVPPGWRLVPVEPTEAMIEAGAVRGNWSSRADAFDGGREGSAKDVWAVMLAAVPPAPASEDK
jgi:hypothetical protein